MAGDQKKPRLNPMQQAFVAEYLVDHCAKAAALRAGYSEKTASQQSSKFLDNPKIAAAINEKLRERLDRVDYQADQVLRDMLDVLPAAKAAALSGEPRAINAFRGLMDSIGKHADVQAWQERIDVNVGVKDAADALDAAHRRLEERARRKAEGK